VRRRFTDEDGIARSREVNFTDLPASLERPATSADQHASDSARSSPYLDAFRAIYERLSDEDRVVVEHLVRGEPRTELARVLAIPIGTAKMRAFRMRARLKEAIEAHLKVTKA
jgi:DNA-directed RNA polymerase specialized sigma24 family protein